jgi:aspartyl-tRNA(Asn)/glutamyl-tRNA(Gln) amidotransferase subunit A
MSELTKLTIAQARTKLRAKEFSAAELADAYLGAIARANPLLNAYIAVTPEKAREMAKASDAKLAKGEGGALEAFRWGSRTCSQPKVCIRRPAAMYSTASSRAMNRR